MYVDEVSRRQAFHAFHAKLSPLSFSTHTRQPPRFDLPSGKKALCPKGSLCVEDRDVDISRSKCQIDKKCAQLTCIHAKREGKAPSDYSSIPNPIDIYF